MEVNPFEGRGHAPADTPAPTERVQSAAIEYRGELFPGVTHGDAWEALEAKHPEIKENDTHNNGFITNFGRFVGREEALEIAERNDQLKSQAKLNITKHLWSEDLK